jgi:hypothetical protein
VDERIGELAGVSRDTVRKVKRILEDEIITGKIKEDLRLGKLSINEAYEKIELNQESQSLYQKYLRALEELKKSSAEIDNLPELAEEEKESLRAQGEEKLAAEIIIPFRNCFEKNLDCVKAYAAFSFWIEYRANKNYDVESVAGQTLKEIVRLGIEDDMQTLPWRAIEKIIHHAAIENKINVDKIRNSKAIEAQLELLRQEQEAGEKGLN